mgnify:CR=1 FL=1
MRMNFWLTAAGQRNRNHVQEHVKFVNVPFAMEEVLYDPQTSGGLLVSVSREQAEALQQELQEAGLSAAIVGEVLEKKRDRDYGDDVGLSCNNRS